MTQWHVETAGDDDLKIRWIEDEAGQSVCDFYHLGPDGATHLHPDAEEYANRIVDTHNSEDELTAQNKELLEALESSEAIIRALHEEVPDAVPALLLARIQAIIKSACGSKNPDPLGDFAEDLAGIKRGPA